MFNSAHDKQTRASIAPSGRASSIEAWPDETAIVASRIRLLRVAQVSGNPDVRCSRCDFDCGSLVGSGVLTVRRRLAQPNVVRVFKVVCTLSRIHIELGFDFGRFGEDRVCLWRRGSCRDIALRGLWERRARPAGPSIEVFARPVLSGGGEPSERASADDSRLDPKRIGDIAAT